MTRLGSLFRVTLGIYAHAFDANHRTVEGPVIYIAKTSGSERVRIDFGEAGWNLVRRRKCHPSATYASEFAQTFPGSATGVIEIT